MSLRLISSSSDELNDVCGVNTGCYYYHYGSYYYVVL